MVQDGRSRVQFPTRSLDFFNLPNPSSRTMTLESTQPLNRNEYRNLPGGKERPEHKAHNLTALCEPTVYKMWEPRCFTTLWASMAHYRNSFTFYFLYPSLLHPSCNEFKIHLCGKCRSSSTRSHPHDRHTFN
jgi:hypothetical protein